MRPHPCSCVFQGVVRMTDAQRQQQGLSTWHPSRDASSDTERSVKQRSIERVECSASSQPLQPPVSVDDVLRSRKWLDETEKEASVCIAALAVAHSDAALLPLDVQHNPECVTAAAVVPRSMLADDE